MEARDTQEKKMLGADTLDPRLSQTYEVLELIGRGGMGVVFKARHRVLGQTVAIKRMNKEGLTDEVAVKRFLNEGKAASRLKHGNLVTLHDFGVDSEGYPFAIMDYIDGASLSEIIGKKPVTDYKMLLDVAAGVAGGLAHAHLQGIIHRDIKPSNIIVSKTPEGKWHGTIVDFGIAKLASEEGQSMTQTGEIFGSPFYLSPEQALGQKLDQRTDIYSFGCVLFECITGSPPFVGENPVQTAMMHVNKPHPPLTTPEGHKLPEGLGTVVKTCLEKNPEDRLQNAIDLETDLIAVRDGNSLTKRLKSEKSFLRRHKYYIVVGLATVLVLCAFASVVSLISGTPHPSVTPFIPKFNSYINGLPLSDMAKEAVSSDARTSLELFKSGEYERSAFYLKNSTGILKEEIERLKNEYRQEKEKSKRKKLRQGLRAVQGLVYENIAHTGRCFYQTRQWKKALPYYDEAIPPLAEFVKDGWKNYDVSTTYKEYLEVLRETHDARLPAAEADYKLVQAALSGR